MERIELVCKRCRETSVVEVLSHDEVSKDPDRPRHRVVCPKCGSPDVIFGQR
jgi:Zn finger protein HypA/HybF involved in hydrogenase expression